MTVDVAGRPASQSADLGKLVTRHRGQPGALLSILETLQQGTKQNFLDRQTLEEVGRQFKVTRERIRQIEAKALRKLRHPSRSRKLKDYLE